MNFLATICIIATCAMMIVAAPSQAPLGSSSAPAPEAETNDCSSLVYDLMDCMEYLVVGGSETAPSSSCCLGFKSLMEDNKDCMCYALDASASLGLEIDMIRAQVLPFDCRVPSPPISSCNVSTSPSGSPANSPKMSAPNLPPAPAPARGGAPPAASPAPTPAVAPAAFRRMGPRSIEYGPAAAPSPAQESGEASAISATFPAFVILILLTLF